MKLIVNGDDFGLTAGVSRGIIKAIKEGIMTDTSAMTNMPYFEEAIAFAKENGINEMGIHLTITCGKSILSHDEIGDIIDENGKFYRQPSKKIMVTDQVEKELRAQIEKFLSTGMKLNHLDSHHHFYMYDRSVFDVVRKLAKEYNVPMRCMDTATVNEMCTGYDFDTITDNYDTIKVVHDEGIKCPDYLITQFYADGVSEDSLINMLSEAMKKYDVVEVMSHPSDEYIELKKISSYNTMRMEELNVLTSPKVKKFIKDNNIELISYSEL